MKSGLIAGIVITLLIVAFLLWGVSYHQPQCIKQCEEAEVKYDKIDGELVETDKSCLELCQYFLFDGKQIWFFNWRIK